MGVTSATSESMTTEELAISQLGFDNRSIPTSWSNEKRQSRAESDIIHLEPGIPRKVHLKKLYPTYLHTPQIHIELSYEKWPTSIAKSKTSDSVSLSDSELSDTDGALALRVEWIKPENSRMINFHHTIDLKEAWEERIAPEGAALSDSGLLLRKNDTVISLRVEKGVR